MKDYKKILEGVVNIISTTEKSDIGFANICSYIGENCPELKESDDERIRKELLNAFQEAEDSLYMVLTPQKRKSILAWLEKQGEQPQGKTALEAAKEEKVDNQNCAKPADKVEPKFKVGDWITDGEAVFHITSYSIDYGYQLETPKGTSFHFSNENVENKYHLWTIDDAKDGDVLSDETTIFIFKDLLSDGSVMSYCDYDTDSGESDAFCPSSVNLMCSKITPATKEQRDQLERAMTNAGYKWNDEKKELEKIEDEEYNGEDYGIDSLYHAQRILEKTLGKVDGYQTDDGILSHKCAITAVKKLYEQKPAWSEKDEQMINAAISFIEHSPFTTIGKGKKNTISWLKSLKNKVQPQNTWKPSDEQIVALKHASNDCSIAFADMKILTTLYEQLKALHCYEQDT